MLSHEYCYYSSTQVSIQAQAPVLTSDHNTSPDRLTRPGIPYGTQYLSAYLASSP